MSLGGMSSWGQGITAPVLAAPTAIGGIDVVPKIATPGAGGLNQSIFGGGLGANMDTAKLALSGIGTLGSLWGAFKAASLADKQFKYTRDVTETNLANQLKTYNTGLTDRANNRAIVEGRSPAETAAYIDANKLTRYGR
jgi:hypothetical protein